MKKVYLAIKFHKDFSNRKLIEGISAAIEKAGYQVTVFVRDFEKWGEVKFTPRQMMALAFESTRKADLLVIEFSEKGVGLGIEAGYASAIGKPIVIIAKRGSDISSTIQGVTERITLYDKPDDLTKSFESHDS